MRLWPFTGSIAELEAERLEAAVVGASREPWFYGASRVPDTLEGRFELLSLHAALALIRLKAVPNARATAQYFTDRLFKSLDAGLREAAVGDLAVPKRMHALAGDFYGRLGAYAEGLAAGQEAFEAALIRNMLGEAGRAFAPQLAAYALALAEQLNAAPEGDLSKPETWRLPAFGN